MLLKKLSEDLKRGDMDIWSLDGCHFYQHGTILAMWVAPEDAHPAVMQYPTRKCVSVFCAVNIRTGEFVGMVSEVFNPITFRRFLTVLKKRGNGKRMRIKGYKRQHLLRYV